MLRPMQRFAYLLLLALGSCGALATIAGPGGKAPDPPKMVVAEVTLAQHPGAPIVARALCPRIAPVPVCMVLGGKPSAAELRITFSIGLDVQNPNPIELPLVEALVGFTAFPGAQGKQNLGAVCVSMCEDPAQCPPRQDACTAASGPEIRTSRDFAGAAAGFLVAVAAGQASLDNLKVRTLKPNATTRVTVSLALDPEQIVSLIATLATEAIAQVKRGQVPKFVIPYAVEGSAWVTVTGLGKLAAGFGPFQGQFELN